jgi:hypothetical protein
MSGKAPESTVLRRRLSPERLSPYLATVGGDLSAALDLYAWNSDLSASLFRTIGHVEIIVRNALHENLTSWSARRFGEPRWYLDPGQVLQIRALRDIRAARERAAQKPGDETPGRIVAELNVGFWRYLLAGHYDRTLWRATLHHAFPGERRRRVVHDAAEVLHRCRNRLAHHEPIFNKPVEDIHFTVLALADWICPVSRTWIEQRCLTLHTLVQRPLPPFRPEPGSWQAWGCDSTSDAGQPPS